MASTDRVLGELQEFKRASLDEFSRVHHRLDQIESRVWEVQKAHIKHSPWVRVKHLLGLLLAFFR